MKKRILSILLLCCMVLTLLPTAAFAAGEIDEQFTLAPGATYYFDLSAMGIPGTVNDALPDKTMRYVPFTYAGTVDSYKLTSEMATTEEYAQQSKYAHSLFIADFAVTHEVSWDNLNTADLIFGKNYTAGGVDYTMRAPSAGSDSTGSGDSEHGTPQSNEWDRILDKNDGYIKNWSGIYSWGQDTSRSSWTIRVNRGSILARFWTGSRPANSRQTLGFRPVLEILNPGTLGSDGLKAVTLDLGGGKLGNSFKDIQIIVKSGDAFTAPSGDGLTRPDGNIGSYFKWLGSDGELYAPGESVPAVVTKLSAQFSLPEQFTLTPGSTYYFDLSGVGIPGTANGSLPDASLHYVPFTYAGTVDAYKLTSEMVTTEEYAEQNQYPHSLFVADFAVTHTVNWNALNDASLIFGKNYAAGGVDYMLRAPSAGSDSTGSGDSEHGTPQSNEWDRILDKNGGYTKNWVEMFSWGQDSEDASFRAVRGYFSARYWISYATTDSAPNLGFSPVLEVLNPGTLGSDGLKVVTLDLGGGKLGSNSDHIQIIVKKGESFTAPASDGLTRPDGNTGSYFKWLGSDGKLYVPGGSVPANVNKLTAQFDYTEQFTLDPGGTYYFDLSGVNIPGTVNDALPDKTMHYVPFTYAGTVDAYKLTSEMVTTEEYAAQNKFAHSLFMADYAVTHTVSWNDLNTADLIFGKDCAAGGVEYMLRAPSVGSGGTGWDDLERATPQSNEWDKTLDKYDGYIKNWSWMHSWGQDTESIFASGRAVRGYGSARGWYDDGATVSSPRVGFRPVLEVLNPGTLGSDGLKAVTLDLGGGKLGNSSEDIQITVKNGKSFTAPASEGLTRPDGNTGNYFKWRGSDGELYAPDDNVPADVTKLTAQFDEQFTLAPGGTYYFDLSGESIPGTADDALPDKTMHYVPFTYAGTVDAYKLTSAMAATDEYAEKNKYAHSLFVADYTVTHTVSWDELNAGRLIFGRDYAAGGVDYILRAPSVGSGSIGSAESQRGTPPSNEWDRILDKNDGYIKNWFGMFSWGQDTLSTSESDRAARGYFPPGRWSSAPASHQDAVAGFRPVLEILSPGSLGSDGLKAVTLDLGGGKLGNSSEDIQIIVKSGESFAAPASDGLTRPDGNTDNYFKWLGSDGELYEPGDNVSADATKLTAQFNLPEQFTLAPGGTYYFDLSGAGIPGTANDALPDATLHYVPFTYAGMVNAYKLTSAMETTEEYAEQNKYDHSLFVAEYNVTRAVSWIDLNTAGLIFGKDYTSDGVDYTLRAPSVGSASTGSYDLERGTPQSNEWDKILDKGNGYIKNWEGMESWGQDIMEDLDVSAHRGHMSARYWNCSTDTFSQLYHGFRPVLEVLGLDTLGADGLKAVTLDLGDGKLGVESSIQIIVIDDSTFTAPASDGLTRPDGNTGSYFMWLGSDGKLYDPGDNVPADVTKLTAQFASSSHSVTITTATLPDGKVGEAYSQTLIATGTTPITWSIIGALPDGLSLNKDTGKISGTPTAAGSSTFTVKATNSAGSDTKELSITITKDAPPAHEHSYGDWRKDGTSHWHECTDDDCPNREESINDKAAHVYDDDADTTCDVCGYERTVTPPSHEHSYGDWSRDGTNHWHECTDDDCPNREESINDKAAHVYTDDADTTCDVCGYERTVTPPSHEHSYGDWRKDGTSHWHECTDDDCPDREESIKDKAAHVYTDDADTTCDTCGYERTITPPAHEHRYGDWRKDGTNHWHECTDADCPNREESIKDKAAHVYTDDADTTCDTCGYERTITPPAHKHRYGDWRKDGTNHWHECTDADCPNREESIKDKAAHVYANDADTTCNTCGYERTVTPPAHEHIVTFDGNGGTSSVGSMTTTNQKLTSLPSASRSGSYSFDGWYTKKNGGTEITTDTEFPADTTVYAHWTYTGGGGSSGYSYYTIKATAGTGGSISPSGNVSVREGRDQTFTITPDKGYAVANVKIDGKSIGAVKSYTFENVRRTHTIEVIFMKANGNPQTGVFVDVATGSYYEDAVDWAVENGITKGTDDTHFSPDGICTRAQAVTFLWRTAGSPKPETRTMPFTDVPVGSYYYDAVLWAVENGITKGTSDTTFSPNMTCSRAQIVTFLWRSEKSPAAGTANPFADVKSTAYYADAVLWAVKENITKGTTNTTFSPNADCTRAQIVTFLWRCKK